MTRTQPLPDRLRDHADATTRAEYVELEAAVATAAKRLETDADDAAGLVGPLVDVLRAQTGEVSTADALVHDPARATAVESRVARLVQQVAHARPSLVVDHARDLATVALERDGPMNDVEMTLSRLMSEEPSVFVACCDAAASTIDAGGGGTRRAAFDLIATIIDPHMEWLPSDTATEPTALYDDSADEAPSTPLPVRKAEAIETVVTAAVTTVDAGAAGSTAAAGAYTAIARAKPDEAIPATPWVIHAIRTHEDPDLQAALLDGVVALAATRPGALEPYLSTFVAALTAPDERIRSNAGEVLGAVAYRDQEAILDVVPDLAAVAEDAERGTAPAVAVLASAAKGDAYSPDEVPNAVLAVIDSIVAVLDSDDDAVLEPATELLETVVSVGTEFDGADIVLDRTTIDRLLDVASSNLGGLTQLHASRTLETVVETDPGWFEFVLDGLVDRLDADAVERRVGTLETVESIFDYPTLAENTPDSPAYQRLLSALIDTLGESTHELAVDALSAILGQDPDALQSVARALEATTRADDARVRIAAYELVRSAAGENADVFLAFDDDIERGLADDDPAVVVAALEVVREVTPEHYWLVVTFLSTVADCLYTDDRDVRRTAAWVLANVSKSAPGAVANEHSAVVSAFADAAPTYDPDETFDVARHLAEVLSNVADREPAAVEPVTGDLAALGRGMTDELDRTAWYALQALGAAAKESPPARDALMDVYEKGTPTAANAAARYLGKVVEETPEIAEPILPRVCSRELDEPIRIDVVEVCATEYPTSAAAAVPDLVNVVTTGDLNERSTVAIRAFDALATIVAGDESAVASVVPAAVEVVFETTEAPVATAAVEALADIMAANPEAARAALPPAASESPIELVDLEPIGDPTIADLEQGLTDPAPTERFQAAFAYRALAADDPDAAVSLLDLVVAQVESEPPLTRIQLYGAIEKLSEEHHERVAEVLPNLVDSVVSKGPPPTIDESGLSGDLSFALLGAIVNTVISVPEHTVSIVERLRSGLDASGRGERIQSALYLAIVAIAENEVPHDGGLSEALDRAESKLRSLLDGTDLERQCASFALTTLVTALPDTLPILREVLETPDHPLEEEAVEALSLAADEAPHEISEITGGVQALIVGANHRDDAVRAEAVTGLCLVAHATGDERATEAVGDALTDNTSEVRKAAVEAFGFASRQPTPLDPALPGLARALASDDEAVRQAAVGALEFHMEPSDRDLDAESLVEAVGNDDDAVTDPALDLLSVVAQNRPKDVVAAGLGPLRDELERRDPAVAGDVLRIVDSLAMSVPGDLHSLVPALDSHLRRELERDANNGYRQLFRLATRTCRRIAEKDPGAVGDAVPELSAVVLESSDVVSDFVVDEARDAIRAVADGQPDAVAATVADAVTALDAANPNRRWRGLDLLAALVDTGVVPMPSTARSATTLLGDDDARVSAAAAKVLDTAIRHDQPVPLKQAIPRLVETTRATDPDRRVNATAALATVADTTPRVVPLNPARGCLTADDHETTAAAVRCLCALPDAIGLSSDERDAINAMLVDEADPETKLAAIELLTAIDTPAATQMRR
ncbi:HEAT repeat domain-containing protein [Haloarchaeobius sp. DYHT-AS-18]|uniref:HEAT repeat domain-containing protein n=1 Tax=Haloarchaeobius sp. DYHT-AS-18 TaxID=3446117 RepID=UPI003EBEBC4F